MMKQQAVIIGVFFFVSMSLINTVEAALYCAVDINGRRCQFVDLPSCQEAVGPKGSCVLNRGELMAPKGGAAFCLAEPWQTECIYSDREACEKVAGPRKAICIINPNLNQEGREWDPEREVDGSQGNDPKLNRKYLPSPDYYPSPGRR
ncbi:MAG: hypothetical protein HQL73_08090 [Magnetococcales bacterium]|nr:hypothetical protein [Magnetococcales bacterium]